MVGVLGLVVGLIAAALASAPLSLLPGAAGEWAPFGAALVMVSVAVHVAVTRKDDLGALLRLPSEETNGEAPATQASNGGVNGKIVMDTSAIIDGRIADITATGFLRDQLIVPRFVLEELRNIADSPDSLRRSRGRRGLEVLNKLRGSDVDLVITEGGKQEGKVDDRLVDLAQSMPASILTTDFNLNRLAEFQGIHVLNVNDLATALRPVLLPGDQLCLDIVQEGKEAGQGLGFLEDGTMVVVENGREYIGNRADVMVTRVLQTSAGRIVFCQPRGDK